MKGQTPAAQTHPDRQRFINGGDNTNDARKRALQLRKKAKKARREAATDAPDAEAEKRLSSLKKRVRDLARELTHKNDMPMTLRVNKERELDALLIDLTSALRKKERSKRITKYHMVRFFERQKSTRLLKKAQKAAASAPADSPQRAELQAAVHEAEVSLNYTMYFPLLEKYVSLWNKDSVGAGFKSPMWHTVEEATAQNTLQKLRERMGKETKEQLDRASGIHKFEELVAKAKRRDGGKSGDRQAQQDDENDSEEEADGKANVMGRAGGFFEH